MFLMFKRIFFTFLILLIISSCRKSDSSDKTLPAGVALTFDDYSVDNWYAYMNFFDSLGIKATFYISNFNKLSPAQINKLHDLQNHGHEIGFHSTSHPNFLKYLEKNKCEKLINEEIIKGLALMNNAGFYPKTFAYPYGAHTDALDNILLKYFKSVRTLNGTRDLSASLSSGNHNDIIHGLGIDESSKRSVEQIERLLSMASEKNSCAILLMHNIERQNTRLQIPLWKFKQIISKAKSLHLKFYTVSEISK